MKNKIKFIFRWLFIPILLVLFWIISPIIFQSPFSFTTLSYQGKNEILPQDFKDSKPIMGSFVGKENNLGALEFMFSNINVYKGVVNFRIREKGTKNWYYQSNFATVLIGRETLVPFGFPIIIDSKGKIYEFALTLLQSNTVGSSLSLSDLPPTFLTIYKFEKSYLLHHPKELKSFLYEKISTSYIYPNFFLFSLRYLFPLFLYIFWQLGGLKFVSKKYKLLGIFFSLSVAYIMLAATLDSYFIIFIIPVLWFFLMKQYRFTSKQTFSWSFIYLIISLVCLFVSQWQMAINAGDIFYGLFLYAILQRLVEQKTMK